MPQSLCNWKLERISTSLLSILSHMGRFSNKLRNFNSKQSFFIIFKLIWIPILNWLMLQIIASSSWVSSSSLIISLISISVLPLVASFMLAISGLLLPLIYLDYYFSLILLWISSSNFSFSFWILSCSSWSILTMILSNSSSSISSI